MQEAAPDLPPLNGDFVIALYNPIQARPTRIEDASDIRSAARRRLLRWHRPGRWAGGRNSFAMTALF